MSKQVEFQVSKRNGPSTTCQWNAPESLEDPRWTEVTSNRDEDVNELALQSIIIKIQAGAREVLEKDGDQAAQEYVNTYKFGARSGGYRRPTLGAEKVKQGGFTEEQMAILRAAGVRFESDQPEAAAEAAAA